MDIKVGTFKYYKKNGLHPAISKLKRSGLDMIIVLWLFYFLVNLPQVMTANADSILKCCN